MTIWRESRSRVRAEQFGFLAWMQIFPFRGFWRDFWGHSIGRDKSAGPKLLERMAGLEADRARNALLPKLCALRL